MTFSYYYFISPDYGETEHPTESLSASSSSSSYTPSGDFDFDFDYFDFTKLLSNSRGEFFVPVQIIFNNPATICTFPDGEKVITKCAPGEVFSEEIGVMACITKKVFGNRNKFKRLVESGYRQPPKKVKVIEIKEVL